MARVGRPKKTKKGPAKKNGRPPLLSADVQRKVVGFIRMGSSPETAAASVGVLEETMRAWMRRGVAALQSGTKDAREKKFGRFAKAMHRAVAEAELLDLERIDAAADGDWRAAAWKLERRCRSAYAPQQQVQVAHEHSGTVQVEHSVKLEDLPLSVLEPLLAWKEAEERKLVECSVVEQETVLEAGDVVGG